MIGSMSLPGKREFYQMRAGPGTNRPRGGAPRPSVAGSVVGEGGRGPGGLALRLLPIAVTLHVIARHILAGKTEAAGELPQEAPNKNGGRQVAEAHLLDRLQIGAPDLRLLGDGLNRQAETRPLLAQARAALGRRTPLGDAVRLRRRGRDRVG